MNQNKKKYLHLRMGLNVQSGFSRRQENIQTGAFDGL